MDGFPLIRLASSCIKKLEDCGLDVEASRDFNKLPQYMADVGKTSLTPKVDPSMNDFLEGDGVWFGLSKEGQRIAVIASVFQDLGTEGLSAFLLRSTNRQYGAGAVVSVAPQNVIGIGGRTAYIGELYVSEKFRGKRDWLNAYVTLVMATCCLDWKADHCYAFFRKRDFMARMPQLYGFTHCVPGVMRWGREVEGRDSSETLASISRPALVHLASLE